MGLTYSLNAGGTSYSVVSNSCTAGAVTIPSTYNGLPVTAVASYAFQNCATITSVIIPESVTTIGSYSFGTCSSLSSVTIPSSLTSIGNYAFNGSNLTSINVNASNPNYSSIDGVLFNKNQTTIIVYPKAKIGSSYSIPSTVTIIGDQAFLNASLTSIIIPNSVTSLGDSAFYGCLNLTSIILPSDLSNIDSFAFAASGLINITIPNNITTIKTSTFRECYNLISVTLPTNLTSIGNFAFGTCINLNNVTIPKKVDTLGSSAFTDCYNLTKINFLGNPPTLGTNAFLRVNADLKVYYLRFTPGWSSTFDEKPTIAFTLSSNIIKSGGTGKLTTKRRSLSAYDPDATIYINNVEAADGQSLEDATKNAINAFVIGCKSDGIWDAIKSSCILSGARTLNGALIPLKGAAPTNNFFISSDYNRATGLLGDGSSKYLNTNRNNNADPQNNNHQTTYLTSFNPTSAAETVMGFSNGSLGYTAIVYVRADGSLRVFNRSNGSTAVVFSSVTYPQFIGTSRSISTSFSRMINNTLTTQNVETQTPDNFPIFIFASSNSSTPNPSQYSNSRIAFYSIGEDLNLSLYKTRVNALMNAFNSLA